jgi:hypothetical protein
LNETSACESEMEIHPEEKYLNPSKGLSFHQKRSYLRKTSKIVDGRLYQSRQTCKVELNPGLDINDCNVVVPVKTDVGQLDLVSRLPDGTSEQIIVLPFEGYFL